MDFSVAFWAAASCALVIGWGRSVIIEMATMRTIATVTRNHGRLYQMALAIPRDEVGIEAGSKGISSKPERSSVMAKD